MATATAQRQREAAAVPAAPERERSSTTARAGNRRSGPLSALRAHTKAPYRTGLHRESLTTPGGPDREPEADAEV